MIDRKHKLPVSHQCALFGLARSSAYDTLREVSPADLALLRWIDEWPLELLRWRTPVARSALP